MRVRKIYVQYVGVYMYMKEKGKKERTETVKEMHTSAGLHTQDIHCTVHNYGEN